MSSSLMMLRKSSQPVSRGLSCFACGILEQRAKSPICSWGVLRIFGGSCSCRRRVGRGEIRLRLTVYLSLLASPKNSASCSHSLIASGKVSRTFDGYYDLISFFLCPSLLHMIWFRCVVSVQHNGGVLKILRREIVVTYRIWPYPQTDSAGRSGPPFPQPHMGTKLKIFTVEILAQTCYYLTNSYTTTTAHLLI